MNAFHTIAVFALLLSGAGANFSATLSDTVRDYSTALSVVPGLEGYGVQTAAGRGGRVVRVTTLAASGEGSLQAALEIPEKRVIIFEAGGAIVLKENLILSHPHVTIAGETAPPPGITLVGAGLSVQTHDVLIRHLRFRVGDGPGTPRPDARDGIGVYDSGQPEAPTRNVILDHCSVAWAVDEGMSTWGSDVGDVTFSRCIVAEGLSHSLHPDGEHSKGMLVGDHSRRVAVLGNLFAHNTERNPFIKGDVSALIACNVIYNPGTAALHFGDQEGSGPSLALATGNLLIPGPDTRRLLPLARMQLDAHRQTRVFLNRNDGGGRALTRSFLKSGCWMPVSGYDASPVRVRPLTVRTPQETLDWVLETAGARPWDRDRVDERIIASVRQGTGRIIDSPREVGGLPHAEPQYRALEIPEDPHSVDPNGYTRLENWIFSFETNLPREEK